VSDRVSGNGQPDALPPRGAGRRRSLITLGVLLLGLPAAFVIRAALDEGWREITSVEILEARDVIYLPGVQVFLVHDEPPLALSALSPHLGEELAFCAAGQNFVSLAHGELFDREGRYIDGPAPHGMGGFGVRVRDGIVEINLTQERPGPPLMDRGMPSASICTAEGSRLVRPGFVEPEAG
jgi:hypothetical protein